MLTMVVFSLGPLKCEGLPDAEIYHVTKNISGGLCFGTTKFVHSTSVYSAPAVCLAGCCCTCAFKIFLKIYTIPALLLALPVYTLQVMPFALPVVHQTSPSFSVWAVHQQSWFSGWLVGGRSLPLPHSLSLSLCAQEKGPHIFLEAGRKLVSPASPLFPSSSPSYPLLICSISTSDHSEGLQSLGGSPRSVRLPRCLLAQ